MPSDGTKKNLKIGATIVGFLGGAALIANEVSERSKRQNDPRHTEICTSSSVLDAADTNSLNNVAQIAVRSPPAMGIDASAKVNNEVDVNQCPTKGATVNQHQRNIPDPAEYVYRDRNCWRDKASHEVRVRNFNNGNGCLTSDMEEALRKAGVSQQW